MDKIIRFRYWILFGAFALWMVFFDSNNLFYRMSVSRELGELEEARDGHKKAIGDLVRQRTELLGNMRNLEKFAREKYMMKRDNEDLFILVEVPKPEK
ncbi:MAG: septum formation initiator family protein [Bacteroidetes bacterium]|nr:septum formation initiator family protein [Bacteroidota bacterium]